VAAALGERGHAVRVLADPVLRPEVEAAGAEHVDWTRAPHRVDRSDESELFRDWEARTPAGGLARMRDGLMFGPAADIAADVTEELERRPADVVVSEMVLCGALVAAEAAGVPSASLITTIYPLPVPGRPPFGPGLKPARGRLGTARDRVLTKLWFRMWDKGLPALNEARTRYGLEQLDNAPDQLLRADRVLVLTSEAFDTGGEPVLPPNVVHTGPRLDDPSWTESYNPPPGPDPLVLVGLSTTRQGQLPALRRIAAALGKLPVRGVITTGLAVDPADVPAPANVQVVPSAPHGELLGEASVVVTHAGHGTVVKALAAGVPLVCLPMGRDQAEVARRVSERGAGITLRPGASQTKIATAVRKILDDPTPRRAAQTVGEAIRGDLATDRAVTELEGLAGRASKESPPPVARV
jgi:MGT family glycosyltransferase